jgi:hypothetical protein
MGRCRFVQPGIVRLPLSEGEWIDVKQELTAGEQRHADAGRYKELLAGDRPTLDYERMGTTRILAYVIGWSLVGFEGTPEPFDESSLDNLDMDTFQEIAAAIDAHERRVSEMRVARKNGQGGEKGSAAILPSPSAAVGASSGSGT